MKSVGRITVAVLAWGAGAAGAITVGVLSLSLIGTSYADRSLPALAAGSAGPSPAASDDDASQPGTPPPSPSRNPIAGHTEVAQAAVDQVISVESGSVTARCVDGKAYLVSWSPAQGYRVDDVRRGPGYTAWVVFESRYGHRTLLVRCIAGVPQGTVAHDE